MTDSQKPHDDPSGDEPETGESAEPEAGEPQGRSESVLTDMAVQVTSEQGAIPFPIRTAAGWAWRFITIVAASAITLWLLVQIKTVVIPVFVAGLVTALLAP